MYVLNCNGWKMLWDSIPITLFNGAIWWGPWATSVIAQGPHQIAPLNKVIGMFSHPLLHVCSPRWRCLSLKPTTCFYGLKTALLLLLLQLLHLLRPGYLEGMKWLKVYVTVILNAYMLMFAYLDDDDDSMYILQDFILANYSCLLAIVLLMHSQWR